MPLDPDHVSQLLQYISCLVHGCAQLLVLSLGQVEHDRPALRSCVLQVVVDALFQRLDVLDEAVDGQLRSGGELADSE